MSFRRFATIVAACLLVAGGVLAAPPLAVPPMLINYQGVLRDASGDPKNGTFNMTFRFFDAPGGGSEMLVDTHSGAQGVVVSGGLFNTQLGGGLVSPGGGPTNFPSLEQVFRAKDSVWLEMVIAGETLAPRVRVISSAYALNASAVGGLDSGAFLRSDASDTYTSGTLTTAAGTIVDVKGELRLNGSLSMDSDGPDGAQAIYFYNSGSPTGASFQWDDGNNRFFMTNGLLVDGALRSNGFASIGGPQITIGSNGPDQDQILAFYEDGAPQGEYLEWDNANDLFYLSDDFKIGGNVSMTGNSISMGGLGIETSQFINIFNNGSPTGEQMGWDDAQDRFEMSDDLAIGGTLKVGSTISSNPAYNIIGAGATSTSEVSTSNDMFISDDLEVGNRIYVSGSDYLEQNGLSGFFMSSTLTVGGDLLSRGDRLTLESDQGNYGYLEYLVATTQFNLSDDLDVDGELTANVKNFVQNHPHDDTLSIVYTTLEGPEASTFTRGSARLKNGVAHVPLDETFAWTTHPDLGLTASLTPRGGWSNLYVESVTTSELVVRGSGDTAPDAAFDYLVLGLHIGYEESPVIRPRQRDAKLPTVESLHEKSQGRQDLARSTPLARYQEMQRTLTGHEVTDFSAAEALRQAVGMGRSPKLPNGTVETERPAEPTREQGAVVAAASGGATRTSNQSRAAGSALAQANPRPGSTTASSASTTTNESVDDIAADPFAFLRANSVRFDEVSPSVGELVAGDVLVLDESGAVRRATTESDAAVVGIAASQPITGKDGTPRVAMALSGIVNCRVDASSGEIQRGTLLVSSPTPGYAMRADAPRPGTIVGKAMDPLPSGTGTIRVLVTLR